ncbi:MAG: hypothetical protein ACK5OA_02505 [Acidovorax sp.]
MLAFSRGSNDGTSDNDADLKAVEQAYGGQQAWEKAKAEGETKLTYGQWLQVRTPKFKAWFGDWEALDLQNRFDAFVDSAPTKNDPRGDFTLRSVSRAEIDEVKRQGGPDISGMDHVLVAHEIKHAAKHGDASESRKYPNQRPLTMEDIQRIPVVLDGYDEIRVQARG